MTGRQSKHGRQFRDALGHYASGITVIGGMVDGLPTGFTCQSFYSVSMTPPLVSFSVRLNSKSWPSIRDTGSFSVNILSHVQRPISDVFGSSTVDRWAGVKWRKTKGGNPAIEDTLLWLDCDIHAEYEVGDHWIVIGRLREVSTMDGDDAKGPLLYFKGRYRSLQEMDGALTSPNL
jgi:flavin reductase (DIM6/NTAB) family NADH-FMN oxidoreductase RutF